MLLLLFFFFSSQQRYYHPRRPRGSQSGRKRRGESLQVRAKEPLGTDSHRTISKNSSRCLLLIGHKKCFVLMCRMGEQFLLSSTDRQKQEVLKFAWPEFDFAHARYQCIKNSNSIKQRNFTTKCGINKIICNTAPVPVSGTMS